MPDAARYGEGAIAHRISVGVSRRGELRGLDPARRLRSRARYRNQLRQVLSSDRQLNRSPPCRRASELTSSSAGCGRAELRAKSGVWTRSITGAVIGEDDVRQCSLPGQQCVCDRRDCGPSSQPSPMLTSFGALRTAIWAGPPPPASAPLVTRCPVTTVTNVAAKNNMARSRTIHLFRSRQVTT